MNNASSTLFRILVQRLALLLALAFTSLAFGQAMLMDFNSPGQFTNNFSGRMWQTPATPSVWFASPSGGLGGSGSLDGIPSGNDTTLTYGTDPFDFSADGKTLNISMMVKIKAPSNNNRALHIGFLSNTNLSMNDFAGASYMSVRMGATAQPALTYNVEIQNRASSAAVTTNTSPTFTLTVGNWYRLSAIFRNIKATTANTLRVVNMQVQDMGASGSVAGAVLWSTNNIDLLNADMTADATVYPGFRAFENSGADNLDNMAAWMTDGAAAITVQPANQTVTAYRPATFGVKVDGTPGFTFTWYTNDVVVAGATGPTLSFAQPTTDLNGVTVKVGITNALGGVESTPATLTVNADAAGPNVVSAGSVDGTTIGVTFDEVVNAAAAANAANYSVVPAVVVTSATLQPDGRRVKLTLGSAITGSFTVTASSISDLAGNALNVNSAIASVMGLVPADISSPFYAGSAVSYNSGDIDAIGGGNDFQANGGDQGFVVMGPRTGDFDVQLRVAALNRAWFMNTNGGGRDELAKAVLMARESTAGGARDVYMSVNPADVGLPAGGNLIQMFNRTASVGNVGQLGSNVTPPSGGSFPNVWFRLRRVNNTFTGYYSTNPIPSIWFQISQAGNLILNDTLLVGPGLTAHIDGDLPVSAQFKSYGDYSVSGAAVAILTNPIPTIPLVVTWPATNATLALSVLATNLGTYFPSNEIQFTWQRGDGLGNFTNIPNVSAGVTGTPATNSAFSTYTTVPLSFAENGVQYRAIARGPGGISATSPVSMIAISVSDVSLPAVVNSQALLGSNVLSVIFNVPLDLLTVSNVANYVITNSLGQTVTVTGVIIEQPGMTTNNVTRVLLFTSTPLTNGTQYTVRINNVKGVNGQTIASNTLAPVPTFGTVKIEIFNNLGGTAAEVMTNFTFATKYLTNQPDYILWTNQFGFNHNGSAFADKFNSYGGRISGLFVAPSNGTYRFHVRGDDANQFWMNTNAVNSWDPAGKVLLCYQTNANASYASIVVTNMSTNVTLVGGQAYYVEGLWKENSGNDGFTMAFREQAVTGTPPNTENADGRFFLPVLGNPYAGTIGTPCPVRVDMFTGITNNGTVDGLTSSAKYIANAPDFVLNMPGFGYNSDLNSSGGFTSSLDNFGGRLAAWFVAPSNGVYRFFLRSDDDSQLFMNTNGVDPAGKVSIAYLPSWRGTYTNVTPANALAGVTNTGVSLPVTLAANQWYYLEALFKDGTGGDGVGVAFRSYIDIATATNSVVAPASNEVITASFLRPLTNNVFTAARPYSPAVLAEVYQNYGAGFSGTAVSDLQNNSKFQASMPDTTWPMAYFGFNKDEPSSQYPGDNHGVRISGYFVAPSNAIYRFLIKNDDQGALFMNTNGIDVAGKVQIASLTGARNNYATNDGSMSGPISLTNGQRYYMEFLFKEQTGGDGGAVTFISTNTTTLPLYLPAANAAIPADFFAPTIGPVTANNITQSTTPVGNIWADGQTVTFSVNGVTGAMPIGVQWKKNGVNIPGANGFSYTYTLSPVDVGVNTFSVSIYNPQSSLERFINLNASAVTVDAAGPYITAVVGNGLQNEVTVTFSENVLAATATNIANYSIPGLTITGAFLRANNQVALLTSSQTPGGRYTVFVSNVADTSRANNSVVPNSSFPFTSWTPARGWVTVDLFNGISSGNTNIPSVFAEPKFINNTPDATSYQPFFGYNPGLGSSTADNFGARVYGWFVPPSNGLYRFYIRSDDLSVLFMNTNSASSSDPNGKAMIAAMDVTCCKNYGDATGGPDVSSNIFLNGGQPYYMEAILREGTGNEGISVAFREAGDSSTPPNGEAIPGFYFIGAGNPDITASLVFTNQPVNVTAPVNTAVNLTVGAYAQPVQTVRYQWQQFLGGDWRDVLAAFNPNGSNMVLTVNQAVAGSYQYRNIATVPGISITSAVATIVVTNLPLAVLPTIPSLAWVSAATNGTTLRAQFSEAVTAATANNTANYGLTNQLGSAFGISSAVLQSDARTVILTVSAPLAGGNGSNYTLTAANIVCADDGQVGGGSYAFYVPAGFLRYDIYSGWTPASVTAVPVPFPNTIPSNSGTITTNLYINSSMIVTTNSTSFMENYAGRVYGYLIPPSNGVYRFFVASDDGSQLWLNPNGASPTGKIMIASAAAANLGYSSVANPTTTSAAFPLNAGQRYYVEALWKEGTGGDYVSVAVREQGNVTQPIFVAASAEAVPAAWFNPPEGLQIVPAQSLTPSFVETATNTLIGTVVGIPALIQWYSNNVAIAAATNATYSLPSPIAMGYNGANIQVVASNFAGIVSNQFTITVTADSTAPTIVSSTRCSTWTNLFVNFSEAVDPASATNLANYIVVDDLGNVITLVRALVRPDGRSVALSLSPTGGFDPARTYYVTNSNIGDRASIPNLIAAGSVATSSSVTFTTNLLALDFYNNISGGSLATLSNDVRFLNNQPDLQMALGSADFHSVQFPLTGTANYGAKMFGWFMPPSNGVYRFYYRVDDSTVFSMNTNGAAPGGKVQLGPISNSTMAYTNTPSVTLTSGTPYYVEMLFAQGTGADYAQMTWRWFADEVSASASGNPVSAPGNGWPSNLWPGSEVAAATWFGVYGDATAVSSLNLALQPAPSATNVAPGTQVTFSVMATNAPANGYIWYQWQAADGSGNFTNVGPGANYISDYAMIGNRSNYVAAFYYSTTLRAIAQLPGGLSVTSATATVTVPNELHVLSASSVNGTNLVIVYSKPVDPGSALESLAYSINGGAIGVYGADNGNLALRPQLLADGRTAVFIPDSTLPATFTVAVGGVADSIFSAACDESVAGAVMSLDFAMDVGANPGVSDPIIRGSVISTASNSLDMTAGGSDIWVAQDGMFFAGRNVTGNFDVRFRLASLTNAFRGFSDVNAKMGIIARPTSAANSRMISAVIAPPSLPGWPVAGGNYWQLNYRDTVGGTAAQAANVAGAWQSVSSPWVRLVRQGSAFIAYRSYDGINWTLLAARDTAVNGGAYPDTILVGFGLTSHNNVTNAGPSVATALLRDIYFATPPAITVQPVDQSLSVGQTLSLSVVASNPLGSGAITYQWRRNGVNINGANLASFTVSSASASDAGAYQVLVANDGGGVISSVANVQVNNVGPSVLPETLSVIQGFGTNLSASFLLGNDSDPEGRGLSVVAVSGIAPVTFFTDFESGVPANSTVYSATHLTNNVGVSNSTALAVSDNVANSTGGWIINDLVPGYTVSAFTANFKVRIGDSTANGADGFSFNVANDLPNGYAGGEEGAGTGLSVCFDNYDNGNLEAPAIDIKWRGAIVAHQPVPKMTNQNWQDVTIMLRGDGTLDVFLNNRSIHSAVPTGYTPISGARWGFFARSGGENETHWLDNVGITVFSGQTASGLLGGTTFAFDFNSGVPAGAYVFGNSNALNQFGGYATNQGGINNSGLLRLTDGGTNLNGSLVFNELLPGRTIAGFTASFYMRISDTSSEPADGFSFNFAPDLPYSQAPSSASAEEGAGTGLSFTYDAYRANGSANNSAFRIKYAGIQLAAIPTPTWNNPSWIPVQVVVSPSGAVTLNVNGTNVVSNFATPFRPMRGRFGFYARTGGSFQSHSLDNFTVTLNTFDSVFLSGGNVVYFPPSTCGDNTLYYLVSDGQGGTALDTATVTLIDVTAPVVVTPASNQVVSAVADCQAVLPNLTINSGLVITDNCSVVTLTQSPPAGTLISTGVTQVTIYAYDAWTNSVTTTAFVTNVDLTAPVLACTDASLTASAGLCSAPSSLLALPLVSDNCGVAIVTNNAALLLTVGTNAVIWTAVDASGNIGTCTQTVVVVDIEVPQIACPATVTVSADAGLCTASGVALGIPVAADNCGIASVVNNAPAQLPVGTNVVTWTATDVNGNFNTCQQLVVVVDTQNPSITAPADVDVAAAPGLCTASGVALGTPVSSDNCGVASVTNNAPTQFPVGTNLVIWTAVDIHGNTATAQQTVVVTETAPVIASQPLGTNVVVGSSISLTVSVASCSVPAYQWYLGNNPLANQTNSGIELTNMTSCDAGSYVVVVTNLSGSVTSDVAIVVITNAPAIVAPGGALAAAAQNDCGSLILAGGSTYNWELADAAGVAGAGWDLITAATGIDVQATPGAPFTVNLQSLSGTVAGTAAGFDNNVTSLWTIASAPNGVTNFNAASFVVTDLGFSNDLAGGVFTLVEDSAIKVKFTPNQAPQASALADTRPPGYSWKIKIAALLTNVVDGNGDTVALVSVSASTNGVSLATNDTYIYYTNANSVDDSFTYTVRDVRAYRAGDTVRTATGTVLITVLPFSSTNLNIVSFGMNGSGKPQMRFAGIPGYSYDIERATNLTPPITWTKVHTTNAPAGGLFDFADDNAPTGAAYYRTAQH